MIFNSYAFLAFFPIVTLAYYLMPMRARRPWLLAASYYFYMCWNAQYALLIAASTLVTYLCALALGRMEAKAGRRAVLALGLAINLGILCFFKYFGFFTDTFARIAARLGVRLAIPAFDVLLPVGISFYTFQSMGYLLDVYNGKYAPQKNLARFALFVSFFPQVIQGPIGRYDQLEKQLEGGGQVDVPRAFLLMLWGLAKKMVIADRALPMVSAVFDAPGGTWGGAMAVVGVLAYSVQQYCDFSGGIDITRGVARLFGIDMAENFRRPIFATSLTDYWRRWHITLGAWMRDYVFYPISLSRGFGKLSRWARTHIGGTAGKIFATSLATFIVYFIIGIWHGANFRYIAFGLWNGVLITASLLLEKTFLRWKAALHVNDKSAGWRVFMTLRTALLVFIGRYFTRAPRLRSVFTLLKTTVLHPQPGQLFDGTLLSLGLAKTDFLVIALGLIVLLTLECFQERGVQIRAGLEKKSGFVQWAAMTALLLAVFLLGVFRAGYIPSGFIYTQF